MHRPETVARRIIAAVALLCALSTCTTTTVTPEFVQKPQRPVTAVALGEITVDEPIWQGYVAHVKFGLTRKLRSEGAFPAIQNAAPETLAPGAILVTGRLLDMDKGSRAARALIGFGAGRARARGEFELTDASGVRLAKFQTWKAYSGGAGIGGFDLVDMEEIAADLGEEIAASLIRWSKGGKLEPPE
jgi:Domain of unknown function (DUF4410)